MEKQKQRPGAERPAEKPAATNQIDLDALTAAVERLLRRDLEIQRERLRPGRRG